MSPAERGLQTHIGKLDGLPEAEAVYETAGIIEPRIATMRLSQRGAGQRVERALAVLAFFRRNSLA